MWLEHPPKWFRALFPGAIFFLPAGREGAKRVFLTFDDGPIPEVTPWVLDILDRYKVKATFFMVGQNAERYPHLLQEVIKRGHETANHSLHHVKGLGISTQRYIHDVEEGSKATGSTLFRPPHGWLSPMQLSAVKKKKFTLVMYDIVTRDYSRRIDAERVVENVKRYAKDGSIIVFHDSVKSWPRLQTALPESIKWLKSRGYEFMTLSEAIATRKSTKPIG